MFLTLSTNRRGHFEAANAGAKAITESKYLLRASARQFAPGTRKAALLVRSAAEELCVRNVQVFELSKSVCCGIGSPMRLGVDAGDRIGVRKPLIGPGQDAKRQQSRRFAPQNGGTSAIFRGWWRYCHHWQRHPAGIEILLEILGTRFSARRSCKYCLRKLNEIAVELPAVSAYSQKLSININRQVFDFAVGVRVSQTKRLV